MSSIVAEMRGRFAQNRSQSYAHAVVENGAEDASTSSSGSKIWMQNLITTENSGHNNNNKINKTGAFI